MTIARFRLAFLACVLSAGLLFTPTAAFGQADNDTTLAGAVRHQLAASTAQVELLNADRTGRYDTAITNFNLNMASGQQGVNTKPPVAPFAWVLTPPDVNGMVFYAISSTVKIVGTVPVSTFNAGAPQPAKAPNVIDIGKSIGGSKWYTVGPDDTFPLGMTTPPQADGHTYLKFGAPVGAGWYLQS